MKPGGYKIVLTADQTLMSEYGGGIFLGFAACIPRGVLPEKLFFPLVFPSVPVDSAGRVLVAPNGTRKIEAALLRHGFSRRDIIVAHPGRLSQVVGPDTKVVGLTENDPLGYGPATSTFSQLTSGGHFQTAKFFEIINHPVLKRHKPKIVVGGPGAWELEVDEAYKKLNIDHLVVGEGDLVVGPLFEKIFNSEPAPSLINGEVTPIDQIPILAGPSIHGVVEISRGCGRGCGFCLPTLRKHRSRPVEEILQEVDLNLAAGRQPLLHAEDVFRYGSDGRSVNTTAVYDLFKAVTRRPGVHTVSISHISLASVMEAPDLVERISSLLGLNEDRFLSPQTGIETGSPRLMAAHMEGKVKPFNVADWPELVVDACRLLQKNHWVPSATLIMGLPGELPEDIQITTRVVEQLRDFKSLLAPLFFVAQGGLKDKAGSFSLEMMTGPHNELFMKCWHHNLAWSQTLFKGYARMFMPSRVRRLGLDLAARFLARTIVRKFEKKLTRPDA